MNFTEEIKKFLLKKGAELVGIAPVERLMRAPKGYRPRDYISNARSVISMAIHIDYALMSNLPRSRIEYTQNGRAIDKRLDELAHECAKSLITRGFGALPSLRAKPGEFDLIENMNDFSAAMSNRHIAVAAGLGEFGLSGNILTPQYGPAQLFNSVITEAPLDPDPFFEGKLCTKCGECIKSCPSGALRDIRGKYDRQKGVLINKQKCWEYGKRLRGNDGKRILCGMCLKVCPVGDPALQVRR